MATLTDNTDVTISNPLDNQLLKYSGGQWINWTPDYITASWASGIYAQITHTHTQYALAVDVYDKASVYTKTATYSKAEVDSLVAGIDPGSGGGGSTDADFLEGQDGAYYLNWNNFTNTPTTLAGYGILDAALGNHNHDSDYVEKSQLDVDNYYSGDMDAIAKSGFYFASTAATNKPANGTILHGSYQAGNHDFDSQLLVSHATDSMYFRAKDNGVWESWKEVYHTGNFDPNTKANVSTTVVDSDLRFAVTGQDLSQIKRTGGYRLDGGLIDAPSWTDFNYAQMFVSHGADTQAQIVVDYHTTEMAFRGGNDGAGWQAWSRVWHSNNFDPATKAGLADNPLFTAGLRIAGGNLDMNNNDITEIDQLVFDDGPYLQGAASNKIVFDGSSSSAHLELRTDGTNRGSLYADNANAKGFLNESAGWQLKLEDKDNGFMGFYGNNVGDANVSYLRFNQSDGTRDGYVGVGSGSNRHVIVKSDGGYAKLDGASGCSLEYLSLSKFLVASTVNHSYQDLDMNGNSVFNTNAMTATFLRVGDGTDGYFYSDSAGRTAFRDGDFYIQNSVSTYYNYATTSYHGGTSGDAQKFRGNTLDGDSWSLTGAGVFTTSGIVHANGGLQQDGNVILNGSDTWLRTTGSTGWFSTTYGGGVYMTDTTFVRVYGSKKFRVDSTSADAVSSSGGFSTLAGDGRGYRFWDSDSYKIYMSADANEPYGVTELTNNTDYNMYFRMNGVGRGFVFYNLSDSSTAAFQITGDGIAIARTRVEAPVIRHTSDASVKEILGVIDDPLERVEHITGYIYNRTDVGGRHAGTIAQDNRKALAESVSVGANGLLNVDDSATIGLLVECVKALKAEIAELKRNG